jgi:hypothetical protein
VGHNVVKDAVIVAREGMEREYPASEIQRPLVRGCSVLAGGKCIGGCGEAKDQQRKNWE